MDNKKSMGVLTIQLLDLIYKLTKQGVEVNDGKYINWIDDNDYEFLDIELYDEGGSTFIK